MVLRKKVVKVFTVNETLEHGNNRFSNENLIPKQHGLCFSVDADSGTKITQSHALKLHVRAILHIDLPSRAQPIIELVPGGRAACHFG